MRQVFLLQAKPFSINAMHYSDARTKTTEYREWTAQILHQLGSPSNATKFKLLREKFDPKLHDYSVHLVAKYPKEIFNTKEGLLSSRTIDCSNWEKPLIDLFFDKQFFDRPSPFGCENLNTNDKYVTRLYSTKREGAKSELYVAIKIVARTGQIQCHEEPG